MLQIFPNHALSRFFYSMICFVLISQILNALIKFYIYIIEWPNQTR